MVARKNQREEHQALLAQLVKETGMALSAIAAEIGVRPSTLNKVADESGKHTHALSTSTLALLADFRTKRRLAGVNAQVDGNLSEEAERQQLLRIWMAMDRQVRNSALVLLEAASRGAPRKISQ